MVINSEDYNAAVKYLLPANKVIIMPGIGVDFSRFHKALPDEKHDLRLRHGFNDRDFILIFAAELNSNKNQQFLIMAMKKIVQVDKSVKLLLAGDGPLRYKLSGMINALGLNDNIFLLGPRNDLPILIPMCDAGVSSSLREGLGLNVIEYLLCGLPVVVSDNRGHREIVKKNINGFICPIISIQEYVNTILYLRNNNIVYNNLASNCRKSVRKFELKEAIKCVENGYKKLAD